MSQSLRDVLHAIVDKLSFASETERQRLHEGVDAAVPAPPPWGPVTMPAGPTPTIRVPVAPSFPPPPYTPTGPVPPFPPVAP